MLQKGKPGSTEYIYKDKYVNGEIISHKCIKQQVLTYPTDKIIVKGNRNMDIINKSYNNKTSYLVKTKYDNKDFNFHSTQSFILQYENVLFFDRWQKK